MFLKSLRHAIREESFAVGYEITCDHWSGQPTIAPNKLGMNLIAAYRVLILHPIYRWRMQRCSHPNMVNDGYGGPDSGCDAGHCPDCGFEFFHRMY